jgi:anthranilate synthase/aminodeoxychorismate synthase-like glutamine amidotransferase
MSPRVLLLDNFDSFTWNVAHGLAAAGADVDVRRVDRTSVEAIEAAHPDLLVISPGPGRPEDAVLSLEALRRFEGRIPVFGICLGMQCMAVAFGGTAGPVEPVHGKVSPVAHDGLGLFQGLPSPLPVGRYHSLAVTRVPTGFVRSAWTVPEGLPMAMRHATRPMGAVQFHPDSFLTESGPVLWERVIRGIF